MISIGIVGASGYTGEELIRLLLLHPEASIDVLTSRTYAGKCVDDVYAFDKKLEKDLNVPVIKNMDDLKKVQKDYMDKEADRLVESFLDKHAADEISLLKTLGGDDPALDTSSLYFKDIDNLKGGNTGNAATRATFYKRGELPPEIRSLLGEYRSPDQNYVNTLYKLMENVENFKYETKVTALAKEGQLPNVLIKPVNLTTGKQGDIPAGYEPLSNISELPKYTEGINIPSRKKYLSYERIFIY